MKIAYFTDTFLPHIGGVVSHILDITDSLAKRGHKITIFAPKLSTQKLKMQGTKICFIPSLPFPNIFGQEARIGVPTLRVLSSLKSFEPDVVHLQTPFPCGIIGRIVAQILKKPIIETFHGYLADPGYLRVLGIKRGERAVGSLVWKFLVWGLNQADLVISPSKIGKKDLLSQGVKKRIKVIPNGISLPLFRVKKSDLEKIRKKYNLCQKVVLYVGRLSFEKSLNILLEAFFDLLKNLDNVSLLIVGDGPARKEVEKEVAKLGIEDLVVLTGFILRDKLLTQGFYQISDVFVTTSKSENQPISVLEAESFGLPIVGVSARGMRELVKNNGILCQPDDPKEIALALEKILTNDKIREKMGEASKEFVKEFSLEETVKKLEKVYFQLKKK